MGRVLRILGIAILIAASLNATAGLCFCHPGQDSPVSTPAGHGCCHGGDARGTLAVHAVGSCCHIESAQRDMTPADAVQLLQPAATVVDHLVAAERRVPSPTLASSFSPSPPGRVLRI